MNCSNNKSRNFFINNNSCGSCGFSGNNSRGNYSPCANNSYNNCNSSGNNNFPVIAQVFVPTMILPTTH